MFAIGVHSLRVELEAQGFEVLGADQDIIDKFKVIDCEDYANIKLDKDVGAVVMGIDYSFNLNKLHLATLYVNELKARLIVTNPDHFTLVQGRRFPGNGCLV